MALATALENNQNVVELNLRYNNIGDQGAIALAELIKKNRVIQHIYLCKFLRNIINSCESVALRVTVVMICLRAHVCSSASNNIGEKGMAALAGTLGHNIVLQSLDLEDNPATGQ